MRFIIITMVFVCSFLAGCSPEAKYKYLSFFVDGVPKPGEISAGTGRIATERRREVRALQVYTHGPYGARMCTSCHEGGFSNKLLFPKEELCLHCHSFNMEAQWVHGPLAGGGCLICHDPHNSQHKYLLVAKAEEFCFYCHEKDSVLSGSRHADAMEVGCSTCHDAHMSERRFMLKKGVDFIDTSETEGQSKIQ